MADLPSFFYGIVSLNWFVDNVVGILALLATVGAIFLAWRNLKKIQEQIELQKQESEQNAIARAWEIVGRKARGNSGKIKALEFLNKKGIPLIGIDLSAETHGGSVWLQGVNLSGANLKKAKLIGADLRYANLSGADLRQATLSNGRSITKLSGADLSKAILTISDALYSAIDETTIFGEYVIIDDECYKKLLNNELPTISKRKIDELGITMEVIGQRSEIENADGNKTRYHALKITLNPPKPA